MLAADAGVLRASSSLDRSRAVANIARGARQRACARARGRCRSSRSTALRIADGVTALDSIDVGRRSRDRCRRRSRRRLRGAARVAPQRRLDRARARVAAGARGDRRGDAEHSRDVARPHSSSSGRGAAEASDRARASSARGGQRRRASPDCRSWESCVAIGTRPTSFAVAYARRLGVGARRRARAVALARDATPTPTGSRARRSTRLAA